MGAGAEDGRWLLFSTTTAVFGCRLVVMDATSWTKLDNQESNRQPHSKRRFPSNRMVDAEGDDL